MFERFTRDARAAVVGAQQVARERGDGVIASQHLLLAIARTPGPAATALGHHGLDAESIESLLGTGPGDDIDPAALGSIGIDLDEVRRRVEDSFGPGALDDPPDSTSRRRGRRSRGGHIPFTSDAKESLELSLRAALRLGHREISTAHIALGILACGAGPGGRLLSRADAPGLRASLEAAARPAA